MEWFLIHVLGGSALGLLILAVWEGFDIEPSLDAPVNVIVCVLIGIALTFSIDVLDALGEF